MRYGSAVCEEKSEEGEGGQDEGGELRCEVNRSWLLAPVLCMDDGGRMRMCVGVGVQALAGSARNALQRNLALWRPTREKKYRMYAILVIMSQVAVDCRRDDCCEVQWWYCRYRRENR